MCLLEGELVLGKELLKKDEISEVNQVIVCVFISYTQGVYSRLYSRFIYQSKLKLLFEI